ncbi:MAG: hypothetical protein ACXAEX_10750 [Promethearchaeota archaeon]|jgi:hypothetical protein
MSEKKEKKKEDELSKVLGGLWLAAMIVCWIVYGVFAAPTYLFLLAISVTIGGPALVGLIYYLIKGKRQEDYDFDKMIGGIWLAAMILSWIFFATLGATPGLFVIAIIITIAGPAIVGLIKYIVKGEKD